MSAAFEMDPPPVGDKIKLVEVSGVGATMVNVLGLELSGELDYRSVKPHPLQAASFEAIISGENLFEEDFPFRRGDVAATVCAKEMVQFTVRPDFVMHAISKHAHIRYLIGQDTREGTPLFPEAVVKAAPKPEVLDVVRARLGNVSLEELDSVGLTYIRQLPGGF